MCVFGIKKPYPPNVIPAEAEIQASEEHDICFRKNETTYNLSFSHTISIKPKNGDGSEKINVRA